MRTLKRLALPLALLLGAALGPLAFLPSSAQDSTSTARRIREASGPTLLTVGSVSDGQFLKRVGSTVVGAAVPSATPGGSDTQIQFNDGGAFGGSSAFTFDKTNKSLTIARGSVTSGSALSVTSTWTGGGTFPGAIFANVTDTSSAAGSLLMDLQVGGASQFKVTKAGAATFAGSVTAAGSTLNNSLVLNGNILLPGAANTISWTNGGTLLWSSAGVLSLTKTDGTSGGTIRSPATSPAQITADQNNYAPGGVGMFLRLSTDASRSLTGLSVSQVDGQVHYVVNVGSNALVLVHESASSTAANRFHNTTGADITLSADQQAFCFYDSTTARWRCAKMN